MIKLHKITNKSGRDQNTMQDPASKMKLLCQNYDGILKLLELVEVKGGKVIIVLCQDKIKEEGNGKDCRPLKDKISARINSWSDKKLSFVGWLQLTICLT